MSPNAKHQQKKKRVLVIGAGSAGMACADQLSLPENRELFDVTLVDVSLLHNHSVIKGDEEKEKTTLSLKGGKS
jgi:malic enzyme